MRCAKPPIERGGWSAWVPVAGPHRACSPPGCVAFYRSGTRPYARLLLKRVADREAWTVIDLSQMQDHPALAAPRRWVEDLTELYC